MTERDADAEQPHHLNEVKVRALLNLLQDRAVSPSEATELIMTWQREGHREPVVELLAERPDQKGPTAADLRDAAWREGAEAAAQVMEGPVTGIIAIPELDKLLGDRAAVIRALVPPRRGS